MEKSSLVTLIDGTKLVLLKKLPAESFLPKGCVIAVGMSEVTYLGLVIGKREGEKCVLITFTSSRVMSSVSPDELKNDKKITLFPAPIDQPYSLQGLLERNIVLAKKEQEGYNSKDMAAYLSYLLGQVPNNTIISSDFWRLINCV